MAKAAPSKKTAKAVKATAAAGAKKTKKTKRTESYGSYIHKVLKQVHPGELRRPAQRPSPRARPPRPAACSPHSS
jgi:hypothetical protein